MKEIIKNNFKKTKETKVAEYYADCELVKGTVVPAAIL